MTRVVDRIRKLLALAERGGTEHEAANAAARAAALIAKHGLTDDDIAEAGGDDGIADGHRVVHRRNGSTSVPVWIQALALETGRLCGCFVWRYWRRSAAASWVEIRAVGRDQDLNTFSALLPALLATVRRLTRDAKRRAAQRGHAFSPASYARGVVWTMTERMKAAQTDVMAQIRESSAHALEPRDRAAAAEAEANARMQLGEARAVAAADVASFHAGERDGARVRVPGEHDAITGRLALGPGANS